MVSMKIVTKVLSVKVYKAVSRILGFKVSRVQGVEGSRVRGGKGEKIFSFLWNP